MTIKPASVAREAWARWRRNREILTALAGVFLFLPMLAWFLLVPEPVRPAGTSDEQAYRIVIAWAGDNLPWLILRIGFELFATVAILALFLARDHRDVAGLLRHALAALPGFAFAVVASWGLITLGVFAFVVPGIYVYGRVALTGPVIAAEPGIGVVGAVMRSITLSEGHGWRVVGCLAPTLLAGLLALQLVGAVEAGLNRAGATNPVATAIVAVAAALTSVLVTLANLLFKTVLYRRLAAPRHGV